MIGLFWDANYNPRGWYRPKLNCKMRDLGVPFCETCAESLVVNIYRRLSLINSISLTTAETKGFSVTALQPAAPTVSAQWFLHDVAVPGATGTTLTVHGAALAAGPHLLRLDLQDETTLVRNDPTGNLSAHPAWALEVAEAATMPPQLANISTRMQVLTNDNVLIGGFIVTGTVPKKVLLRAIGSSLTRAGVTGALADPVLEFHLADGSVLTNDDWKQTQQTAIETTGLAPPNEHESAIIATRNPGAYTAIVRGANGGTGVGLVEVYDISDTAGSVLQNISTRGFVNQGDNVMIGGLFLNGADSNVTIRALGPSLPLAGTLASPMLELHDGSGVLLVANDDWRGDQEAEISRLAWRPRMMRNPRSCFLFRPALTPRSCAE